MTLAFPTSPTNNQVFTANGNTWVYNSTSNTWVSQNLTPYDFIVSVPGKPTASQIVAQFDIVRSIYFPVSFTNSVCTASTAATASATFNINVNGNLIGNIIFAAGSNTATFTTVSTGSTLIASGSVLTIVAPSSPDSTLANVVGTLAGYLQ
jgi:hypothetical protein